MCEFIKWMIYISPISLIIAIGIELKIGPFIFSLLVRLKYKIIITEPIIKYFEQNYINE